MPELNANQIAAGAAATLAKDFLSTLLTTIPAKIQTFVARYFDNLQGSVERNFVSCSTVRTIINKDKPVPLDSIYVKGKFRCDDQLVNDDEICQLVRDGRRIVVSGFGGIGKTVLCKYIWLSIFRNPEGRIPIFFELRNLNDITEKDLITYIRISLTSKNTSIPSDQFLSIMAQGRFIFILDGFDEIPDDNRFEIQRQILELAGQYPECGFVVSSRADERFSSWQEFYSYHAVSFDKKQASEVIAKVEFDEDIKKEFSSEILNNRYNDYKIFFSTPLLTLMMLMTYLQIKYIPDSPHVFYRYAFQTLYTLHDASKKGFQRRRYVNISESDFINVFSLFCLVSYIDMEHTFDKREIIQYFENVKTKANVNYNSEMFLEECVESVNFLYKDGEKYSFTHRSFQEYCSAYSATHYSPTSLPEIIDRIPLRYTNLFF